MLLNMITTTGYLLLLGAVLMGLYSWLRKTSFENQQSGEDSMWKNLPKPFSKKVIACIFILGAIGISVDKAIFYAEAGQSYLVQYPWGTQTAVLTPGFHPRWLGETIVFKKFLTVSFGPDNNEDFSGTAPTQTIRFNDSVTADVRLTARFQLPENAEQFLPMAIAYRSQENLINSSLIPAMQESMRNAGRMFSAQEYIGGRGGDFENAVLDQIRNGIYLLDVEEDRSSHGLKQVTDEATRTIQQDQTIQVCVNIRRDMNGQEMRKDSGENPLEKFGITLAQANVQDVDPDPKFKEKLQEQRDAAAQVAIERQNARKEEERKKRIIAQGEAEKAETQIGLEKKQIEQVVAAETKAKMAKQEQLERITQAETQKREAEIERQRKEVELETAKLEAQRQLELAQAEAKARELKMKADNALEQRLAAYVEVSRVYAEAIRGNQIVPQVVVQGSEGKGGSNATDLINLLTAKAAHDLGVTISESAPPATAATK